MEEKINVCEFDLTQNIDLLFRLPIYIYGAGYGGQRVEYLMKCSKMNIRCFIDRRAGEIQRDYDVIDIDTFNDKLKQKNEECVIVLAYKNCEELLEELRKRNIHGKYIFTGWAVEVAILSNLDDGRFPKELGKNYLNRKRDEKKKLLNQLLEKNIWVWQPGKVGSLTVWYTLKRYGVESVHIHDIARLIKEEGINDDELQNAIRTKQIKIITLVREPIARDVADYFENYDLHCINKDLIQDVLLGFAEKNHQFMWFDWEIKDLLKIDIFEYPFDREKGYGLIKKGNIEILILKLERLNENVEILGKFLNLNNLVLENANEGAKKPYAKLYKEVKETLIIPQKVIDSYYKGNNRMDHFYTEEEKAGFLKKKRTR